MAHETTNAVSAMVTEYKGTKKKPIAAVDDLDVRVA
jgi:hypothetical protein